LDILVTLANPTQPTARILVMDDEQIIRLVTSEILKVSGFHVSCVNDGKQAIEAYEQSLLADEPFDCIIMDLTVPTGIGGKEAIKDILAINPTAKVIVSSGYIDDPIIINFKEYGFKGAVVKPYNVDQLYSVVNSVLNS